MSWYLSQIGRREHYALPAFLHAQGSLAMMATDVWAPWTHSMPRAISPKKLAQRYAPALRNAKVISPPLLRVIWSMRHTRHPEVRWLRIGESFGKFAAKEFIRHGLGDEDQVLGYTGGNLEQLIAARERGAAAYHIQVDPGHEWYLARRLEQEANPDIEARTPMPHASYMERVEQEWQVAERIIVHSEHSLQCLVARGVAASKCVVIPPAFTPAITNGQRLHPGARPFRVLFVGQHCVAKGFHVYASAARIAGKGFEFISIGRSSLRDGYAESVRDIITMLGHLPQSEVYAQMKAADAFVFPTLSDGFGMVQLEAMSAGLPVIATAKCGAVVRDGIDGFIVPTGDAQAIATSLIRLREDVQLYEGMSQAAAVRSTDFSPASHIASLTAYSK